MNKYIIGYNIDNMQTLRLDDEQLPSLRDSLVVVVLTNESNGKLYNYYSVTRQLIINNNRLILILDGHTSRIRKQISMLLMSYRIYDIYTIDDLASIDKDYIESLESREPSESEVTTFVGPDITAYAEINNLLTQMIDSVNASDIDKLREIIEFNRENIEDFIDVIDYMKQVVDKVNSGDNEKQVKELREKVDELQSEIESHVKKVRDAEREVEIAKEDKEMLQKEAFQAKQRASDLEEKLNSREPTIKTYTEIQTQMIRCKVKVVLYFKEVSHISYISSMVTKLMEAMSKIKKLKVKLLIYDNKHSFLGTYKPIPIVGSSEFVSNRDIIVNKNDKLVVVEANQALIEEVLKSDWDVVIIYDRLKQANDIVSGNNVYKYWVLNSMTEYNMLKTTFKIDKRHIITRPGVMPDSLSLQTIKEYKTHTAAAKLSDYLSMQNIGDEKGKLFDLIMNNTNINTLQGRGRE